MAMIDYGAVLKVNGTIVNSNEMFMETSDTGYMIDVAVDKDGYDYDIDGNYFVSAGDEDLMICFYKTTALIISNKTVIKTYSWKDAAFPYYNIILDNGNKICFEHITIERDEYNSLNERYIAKWQHNNKNYECLFGYGIDNNKEVYNSIKHRHYDYTEEEIKFIDEWLGIHE